MIVHENIFVATSHALPRETYIKFGIFPNVANLDSIAPNFGNAPFLAFADFS